ncbi:MAG: hypothetical protein RIQ52_865 [Pseudomonadota bacterium]
MHNPEREEYLPRDFVETADGLFFALIDEGVGSEAYVTGWLRYHCMGGHMIKLETRDAMQWMQQHHPDLVVKTERHDAYIHAIPLTMIRRHYKPVYRLREIMENIGSEHYTHDVFLDIAGLMAVFVAYGIPMDSIGITGSTLVNAQHSQSDIDLVVYDETIFSALRRCLLTDSQSQEYAGIRALNDTELETSWIRRGRPGSLEDYQWHEKRKGTQGIINGRKFDIALVAPGYMRAMGAVSGRKQGLQTLRCRVIDAGRGFHQPSVYEVDHHEIHAIHCYTQTYVGQAWDGEWVEACGLLEATAFGMRLIVGCSREAEGEYIRVIRTGNIQH